MTKHSLKPSKEFLSKTHKVQEIIKRVGNQFDKNKTVVAWTGGKDSTVLLHMIRSVFNGELPFPVFFNDSTMEFEEIYDFIKRIKQEWNLNLIVIPHDKISMQKFNKTRDPIEKKNLSRIMKIEAIDNFISKYKPEAFLSGIRWDEHESRSKEKYFSPRENHMRVHPILDFLEKDIWQYINLYKVPYCDLYDKGYRSLGEKMFTSKSIPGKGERSGREQKKEETMDKLRSMGYW